MCLFGVWRLPVIPALRIFRGVCRSPEPEQTWYGINSAETPYFGTPPKKTIGNIIRGSGKLVIRI